MWTSLRSLQAPRPHADACEPGRTQQVMWGARASGAADICGVAIDHVAPAAERGSWGVPRPDRLLGEAMAFAHAGGLYATGFSRTATEWMSRRPQRDLLREQSGSGRAYPVLCVHGVLHNRSWAIEIARGLTRQGFFSVSENYPTVRSLDAASDQFAAMVFTTNLNLLTDKVHVVTHSLGGVVARLAFQRHPHLRHQVASVLTVGSPHGGSPWSPLFARIPMVRGMARDLTTGSDFLAALDAYAKPTPGVPWVSIYSPDDIVVPGTSGALTVPAYKARHIAIPGLGHMELAFSPRATKIIAAEVARIDSEALEKATKMWIRHEVRTAHPATA